MTPRKQSRRFRRPRLAPRSSMKADIAILLAIVLIAFLLGVGFWAIVLWVAAKLTGVTASNEQILGVALVVSVLASSLAVRR